MRASFLCWTTLWSVCATSLCAVGPAKTELAGAAAGGAAGTSAGAAAAGPPPSDDAKDGTIVVADQEVSLHATSLDLARKKLPAPPAALFKLRNLTSLYLERNTLTSLSGIGQLTKLQYLDVSSNQLTDLPEELGQLTELQYLCAMGNRLKHLPQVVGRLTHLEHLDLKKNDLTDLPTELEQLRRLRSLHVSHNPLGVLPPCVLQLRRLSFLHLANSGLTCLPAALVTPVFHHFSPWKSGVSPDFEVQDNPLMALCVPPNKGPHADRFLAAQLEASPALKTLFVSPQYLSLNMRTQGLSPEEQERITTQVHRQGWRCDWTRSTLGPRGRYILNLDARRSKADLMVSVDPFIEPLMEAWGDVATLRPCLLGAMEKSADFGAFLRAAHEALAQRMQEQPAGGAEGGCAQVSAQEPDRGQSLIFHAFKAAWMNPENKLTFSMLPPGDFCKTHPHMSFVASPQVGGVTFHVYVRDALTDEAPNEASAGPTL